MPIPHLAHTPDPGYGLIPRMGFGRTPDPGIPRIRGIPPKWGIQMDPILEQYLLDLTIIHVYLGYRLLGEGLK